MLRKTKRHVCLIISSDRLGVGKKAIALLSSSGDGCKVAIGQMYSATRKAEGRGQEAEGCYKGVSDFGNVLT